MTFLNAWAFGFAALAPVIVLLYLLKLKRRPVSVSTLMFWQRLMQDSRRRAFFQKLRQLLSLLLHLLIFALILGALLRPTLDRFVRDGASTVLILDTRARMQATEPDGASRFSLAKSRAVGLVRQASAQRQMAIISADAAPSIVTPFTDDEKILRENLDTLAPTDATGDLDAAIRLADELLASRKGARQIIVLTDRAPATQLSTLNSQLSVIPTGTARDNVAITRLATRPLLSSPQTSEVLLEIANFGSAPAKGNVELSFDGQLLDVKPIAIAAGERKMEIFPTVPRPSGSARGWFTARLDTPDALAADNIAYAILPVQQPRRVLLVTKGNWFLEKLLAADQTISFELLLPEAFKPELAASFDAVVLDNYLPENFDLAATPGNFLFIKQTPFADGQPAIEQPLISDLEAQHPTLRMVSLQNVTFLRAASLAVPKMDGWKWQAPIRSFDHPLLITGEKLGQPSRRIAALALDITDSDLPLRVAFPLLISNTLQWLAGEQPASAPSVSAGETIALAAEETLSTQPLTKFEPLAKPDPTSIARGFFQPLTNGYYAIHSPGGTRWVAVNTFAESESDLRSASAEPGSAAPALPSISLATLTSWPLWQYLAAAAFALFAFEWWLFHRRRTE